MAIVSNTRVDTEEIANRVGRLQMQYAGSPLVKRIVYRTGADWSDDPAVFIGVILGGGEIRTEEVQELAEKMRIDLLSLVRTDEIGVHSYLSFKR